MNEKRVARLCWNDLGWVRPSGTYGKSKSVEIYEAEHGYGHEEWLFDIGKLIDGYHYGFLEPIGKYQELYEGQKFDIWLYSINGINKKRYWIGKILNVEVIDNKQAAKIKKEYIKRRWIKEMEEQLIASGSDPDKLLSGPDIYFFNIKFDPLNISLNDPYFELPSGHKIYSQSRYNFMHYHDVFEKENVKQDTFSLAIPASIKQTGADNNEPSSYIREAKFVEIDNLHDIISNKLVEKLRGTYGKENVYTEHDAGYNGNRVDIIVKDGEKVIFYEIKTYPSLKTNIREAIGQLMEYSFWTSEDKATELVVITQPHGDFDKAKVYFNHLRDKFKLPLYYQSYNKETDILSEKV